MHQVLIINDDPDDRKLLKRYFLSFQSTVSCVTPTSYEEMMGEWAKIQQYRLILVDQDLTLWEPYDVQQDIVKGCDFVVRAVTSGQVPATNIVLATRFISKQLIDRLDAIHVSHWALPQPPHEMERFIRVRLGL